MSQLSSFRASGIFLALYLVIQTAQQAQAQESQQPGPENEQPSNLNITLQQTSIALEKTLEDKNKPAENAKIKYSKGAQLTADMHSSASTVLLITQLLTLEGLVSQSTNIWHDEEFRNTYDNVRDWGTTVGVAAMALGSIIVATQDEQNSSGGAWTFAGGAGVVGIAQLTGIFGGHENGNKMKSLAQKVELTRVAYDDLSARIDMVKSIEQSTIQFRTDFRAFQVRYQKLNSFETLEEGSGEVEERILQERAVRELLAQYNKFTFIVAQIDTILNSYDVLIAKYDANYPIERVKNDMKKIRENLTRAKDNYRENVRPFLELTGRANSVFSTPL